MVEQALAHPGGDPVAGAAAPEVIARWTEVLSGALAPDRGPGEGLDLAVLDDAGRVETIRALEELGCVLTAAQARLSADLDASIRAHRAAAGVPRARQGAGVAAQVALARRTSPRRGQQHLGLAGIVGRELPCTWTAWRTGQIDEWKATVVARETGCLEVGDRLAVDAVLGADLERLATCGVRELAGWVAGEAARLDPAGVTARRRRAEADRHVGLRPAPDTMTWLTALLPVADGVAVHAALTRAADTARAAGAPAGGAR